MPGVFAIPCEREAFSLVPRKSEGFGLFYRSTDRPDGKLDFRSKWVSKLDVEKRLKIAEEENRSNPIFLMSTCILDGTVTPADFQKDFNEATHRQWYSHKTKHTGLNQLVLCLMNGMWIWCSKSYPAGKYPDLAIHKKEVNDLVKGLKVNREFVLVDLAWNSQEVCKQQLFVFGHKKPRGGELNEEQKKQNDVLGHFRGRIERTFASLKQTFKFTAKRYHGDVTLYNHHFSCCLALHNAARFQENFIKFEKCERDIFASVDDRYVEPECDRRASTGVVDPAEMTDMDASNIFFKHSRSEFPLRISPPPMSAKKAIRNTPLP